jgi:hypothetical protein
MALSTWVATFVVDNGRVTEEGNRLRNFHRRRLDEADVDLHVLHEPYSEKAEELGTQAIDAIGRFFLNDHLSLTGGLTRAVRETHAMLRDWNRRSISRDQVGVGITAALVGGNTVYLAQAGPTLAYLRRGNTLTRLEPGPEARQPLGEGNTEPALRKLELQEGDALLAASLALHDAISTPDLTAILGRGTEHALLDLYLRTKDLPNFALFVITCYQEAPVLDAGAEAGEPEAAMAGVVPAGAGREDESGVAPASIGRDDKVRFAPASIGRDDEVRFTPANGEPYALPPRERRPRAAPMLVYADTPKPVDITRPVVNLRNERRAGRNDYARTTRPERRFNFDFADARLVQVAAVIVIALGLLYFIPGLIREDRSERLGDFLAASQANLASAQDEPDPAQKRLLLEESRRMANEVLRIDESNVAASDVRAQAAAALQAMDAIFDLGPLATVLDLGSEITGDISVDSLTVNAGVAYLLDSGGGRVIAVPVDGSPPYTAYQEGETYGEAIARAPIELVWQGDDTEGRLLILDAERKLFEARPGAVPLPVPLRRTNTWASVAAIATYDGNFYVLDPDGNQVHRYLPAAVGFDSEPESILTARAILTDAVDFGVEGGVYVTFSDGLMERFIDGQPASFPLGGIDREMTAAGDVALLPESDEVYIADTGNKRIVVAGTDGVFRRQLIATDLTDISALGLDATGAQLYIMVGDTLLTARNPR